MKMNILKAILFCLVIILVLGGCKKDDKSINPTDVTVDDADWEVIIFETGSTTSTTQRVYGINAWFLGNMADWYQINSVQATINDTLNIALNYLSSYGVFYNEVTLEPGEIYNIKFSTNGSQKTSIDLRMPYHAYPEFPYGFNRLGDNNIAWALAQNNQYQYLMLQSYLPNSNSSYDEYIKYTKTSAREASINGDAVSYFGSSTVYALSFFQVQFKLKNRIAVSGLCGSSYFYSFNQKSEVKTLSIEQMRKIMHQIRLQQ